MPEASRVVRSSYHDRDREVDYYSSDDDDRSPYGRSKPNGSTYRTVQRYRVTPSRVEDVDDTRSIRSTHKEYENRRGDRIEIDRRVEVDRERYDSEPRRTERIEVDRRVEVDRERYEPERPRSAIDYDRAVEYQRSTVERSREPERERDRTRTVVYERERERSDSPLPWERRRNDRPWETERDPYELERYSRETEYYDRPEPTPPPIIIRQRAPEPQQIIVQEAPSPAPIIIPQPAPEPQRVEVIERKTEIQQEIIPRPEPRREEDEYYYRRDVRRDDEMLAYDRRDGRYDDGYESEDYVVRKKVVRREARSRSHSPHHRRHLAEGALAGAGAAALLASHREKQGIETAHRGRSVLGGAALGAIGAEVVTRARSRYRDSRESRSRSRSSSAHGHHKLKTALGLAAAAIAAGAAVKYAQNRTANKEELVRGRSRQRSISRSRRYSDGDEYWSEEYEKRTTRSRSKSVHADPGHRKKSIAKAGAGAAIVAGVAEHLRNKSRKRSGQRSQSRVRTAAEIAGSGLAGAATIWSREEREGEAGLGAGLGAGLEAGMVQYGTEPVYTHQQPAPYDRPNEYEPAVAAAAAGAAYGATRRSRSRSHRRRRDSSSDDDERPRSRSRSRSRVRDLAAGALGTGAAAIGINEYKKRKDRKEKQEKQEKQERREKRDAEKHERERERRRYEDEASPESYYTNFRDDTYSPSPPHASGGSYYPENNQFPPPPTAPDTFTHHGNQSTPFVNTIPPIPPYNPQDYAGQRPVHDTHVHYPPVSRTPGDNIV
ncbi:hypothetical protein DID88_005221 [Monilinia fructigena]|uniref:DUF3824 domain-containing protein n=1 Tax=Monilinia fructigena TaxID=38457 RepID=A0A395IIY0_9HELO|nr:hypothetical protein DID88_005221 [Monilinia fructigena]